MNNTESKITIWVALIGLIGTLVAAFISNYDKFFPKDRNPNEITKQSEYKLKENQIGTKYKQLIGKEFTDENKLFKDNHLPEFEELIPICKKGNDNAWLYLFRYRRVLSETQKEDILALCIHSVIETSTLVEQKTGPKQFLIGGEKTYKIIDIFSAPIETKNQVVQKCLPEFVRDTTRYDYYGIGNYLGSGVYEKPKYILQIDKKILRMKQITNENIMFEEGASEIDVKAIFGLNNGDKFKQSHGKNNALSANL